MSFPDTSRKSPRILVFAGPNGSGKSTIAKTIPICGIYVNADDIKRTAGCTDLEAAIEAEKIREHLLAKEMDFTFETVLSTDRNLELLRRAREKGYEIYAVFVLTSDSSINKARVKNRAQCGGHDVPAEKIVSRYKKSLANLAPLIRIAGHTRVIDNSTETPCLICEAHGSVLSIFSNAIWPEDRILSLIRG